MNDKYQASKIKIQAFDISPQFAYEFIKILKEYNIEYLSFCILCGCDYFKINGVGSKLAYYAVKDYNNYIQSINFF